MINNLLSTIMNAGMYAAGGNLGKDFNMTWTYPKEKSGGKLSFKNIKIQWKETGKFMLYFVVDGIESNLAGILDVQEKEKTF